MHFLESLGYFRVAVASPEVRVADVDFNARSMITCLETALESGARLIVFPELSLTAYSCADLFYQRTLLDAARAGLARMAEVTSYEPIAVICGFPFEFENRLYNCAALLSEGDILGIVPKSYLPNTREFYEQRWFCSGKKIQQKNIRLGNRDVPFGTDLLFRSVHLPDCVLGIELCEDLWTVHPPSGDQALAGATLIANLSASNELLGKHTYRKSLVEQQSARCHAAYLYAASNAGESSGDVVYSGHGMIAENGHLLAELPRFEFKSTQTVADIDCARLIAERTFNSSFRANESSKSWRVVDFRIEDNERFLSQPRTQLIRPNPRHPFVPANLQERDVHCQEVFAIQSTGLAQRILAVNTQTVTLGISGGLDSTLALLVAVQAFDKLKLDRTGIVALTLPGFGTTDRTRGNALKLAELLGVTVRTIPIAEAVQQHFSDIGHNPDTHNVVYENAQARERTQILMDVANQTGGFVVGTGDLSESALGWCTFNGDHSSMYHVNSSVPKTLVRYLIEWCAHKPFCKEAATILEDICATPVTPELLPLGAGGTLMQETEKTVGPYELHDFFLFHTHRTCSPPAKVLFLAEQAFNSSYSQGEILHWLEYFYRRFFSQQFKRASMPEGPKVGSVALSPRGDWRMPSEASPQAWLDAIEQLKKTHATRTDHA